MFLQRLSNCLTLALSTGVQGLFLGYTNTVSFLCSVFFYNGFRDWEKLSSNPKPLTKPNTFAGDLCLRDLNFGASGLSAKVARKGPEGEPMV